MTTSRIRLLSCLFSFLLVSASLAQAGDISFGYPVDEQIVFSGAKKQRVSIVFIGDGYRSSDQALYRADVQKAVTAIFSVSPFKELKGDINVYQINAFSKESGIDKPAQGIWKNTAFDGDLPVVMTQGKAQPGAFAIHNLANYTQALQKAPGADAVIVVLNDRTAGTGSRFEKTLVTSASADLGNRVVRFLGEQLASLADESAGTSTGSEPGAPNLTRAWNVASSKWGDLLGFYGIGYFEIPAPKGKIALARPTQNGDCLMHTFTKGRFCPVCVRALIRAIGTRRGEYAPEAFLKAAAPAGSAPLRVEFTGYATDNTGWGEKLTLTWNFGDGKTEKSTTSGAKRIDQRFHGYKAAGLYTASITVTDGTGRSYTAPPVTITVK